MLKVRVVCIGRLKENFLREGCAEYIKRLGGYCNLEIVELAEAPLPQNPSQRQIDAALEAEGQRIIAQLKGISTALCIEGRQSSSEELAEQLKAAELSGEGAATFVIGSSHGLSPGVKSRCSHRLSMSRMTFPHQLARLMLLEQLYRAFSIAHNGKYHK